MDTFPELLIITLPALVVAILAYLLIRQFLEKEVRRQELFIQQQLKHDLQKTMLPLRLQAYERLVLLLERISPATLLLRVSRSGMTAAQLHSALTLALRDEFDHNLSQQVYVSGKSWENLKNAREELIRMINSAATKLSADATGADLAEEIFTLDLQPGKQAYQIALDQLKEEFREFFS
jgi:hypothetical protein